MEEWRSNGLCYNRDEKYSFNHVCKNKRQLFSMEVEEEEENEYIMDNVELFAMMAQGFPTDVEGSIMPCVSVHAMNGVYDCKKVRVTSTVKGKAVQVLIDTGSTQLPGSCGNKEFVVVFIKLHGMPKTIVSVRDVVFTSKFWKELFSLKEVSLLTSTVYQPQIDGQTEVVVNRCPECYLRCMTFEKPKPWP
ncbi:hypothetical protein FXO37_17281 [Capsicum annuum]|nr:hypothetical protein FXO37_17281 [Capsicum annuum]